MRKYNSVVCPECSSQSFERTSDDSMQCKKCGLVIERCSACEEWRYIKWRAKCHCGNTYQPQPAEMICFSS